MIRFAAAWTALFIFQLPLAAGAETAGSSESGFLVKNERVIAAQPDRVYAALTNRIHAWWDPAHTYTGHSKNLRLEARPGGCFCENLPGSGGVRHMEVIYSDPGKILRMTGALGPLQAWGLAGSMTVSLQAAGDSTRVEWTYAVGGYMEGGLQKIAPAVDTVLREQLVRLKNYVETGNP